MHVAFSSSQPWDGAGMEQSRCNRKKYLSNNYNKGNNIKYTLKKKDFIKLYKTLTYIFIYIHK